MMALEFPVDTPPNILSLLSMSNGVVEQEMYQIPEDRLDEVRLWLSSQFGDSARIGLSLDFLQPLAMDAGAITHLELPGDLG